MNITTLEQYKPEYRAVHVTAEYKGRRYIIAHAPDWHTAEVVALDFVAGFTDARFFTGDVYGSQAINGKVREFKSAYNSVKEV
jgi:hypothetical protein